MYVYNDKMGVGCILHIYRNRKRRYRWSIWSCRLFTTSFDFGSRHNFRFASSLRQTQLNFDHTSVPFSERVTISFISSLKNSSRIHDAIVFQSTPFVLVWKTAWYPPCKDFTVSQLINNEADTFLGYFSTTQYAFEWFAGHF